ncbi:hypothetical protein JNB_06769 [Janibacter sp. HTCC2649]|uniref:TIGR02466 family protein n=1 Tax=Janibacter sp. HTCC2649 TaxID=313589 RepID=UPI00006709A9|nr:TIGR02466 family protein [Janibacter sp. HTCC2649]EAP99851.1 hypothetical protein JNB_06769 [Janibacter sp. HTCC2649]
MALDTWFPLAVHHEDLDLAPETLERLVLAALSLAGRTPAEGAAWTGDIDGVDTLHHDPDFDELTAAVAAGVWAYLAELGHPTHELDLLVQRAWPVVAAPGSRVAPHVHPTAHVSAVVHLRAPGPGGELSFANTGHPNELATGAGAGAASGQGPLSHGSAVYQAVAGRLLVFPAKQRHEVLPHGGAEARVSVSYDLVVSSRADLPGGVHEFDMPPPDRWRRLPRPAVEEQAVAGGRVELAALSRGPRRARHAFVDPRGHLLWSVTRRDEVLSRRVTSAALAAVSALPVDELSDDSSTDAESGSSNLLEAFRCVVDVVDEVLTTRGIATMGALVEPPAVVTVDEEKQGARAGTDLVAWVRLDEGGECHLAVGDGDDAEQWELAPRCVLVCGGYLTSRLVGRGTVMRVGIDVPSLARTGAASSTCGASMSDVAAFFMATALPLSAPRPSASVVGAAARAHGETPADTADTSDAAGPAGSVGAAGRADEGRVLREISARLLDRSEELATLRAEEIEALTALSAATAAAIGPVGTRGVEPTGSDDVTRTSVLEDWECETLVHRARERLSGLVIDSVDGRPEYQVDFGLDELEAVLGESVTRRLQGAAPDHAVPRGVFVRHFSERTRPFIPFHPDDSHWTVNVPLEDPDQTSGGELVMLLDGGLRVVERRRGWAISHPGALIHGVRRVTHGDRWSLIAFYEDARQPAPALSPTPSIT